MDLFVKKRTSDDRIEINLVLNALSKNKFIYLVNHGSGMGSLFPKSAIMGVTGIDSILLKNIEIGQIVIFDKVKILMGARVISRNPDSLFLKSDCGRGNVFEVKNSSIVGLVTHIQINDKFYPIYSSPQLRKYHEKVAKVSKHCIPISTIGKLNVFAVLIRKYRKWEIHRIHKKIIKLSRK